MPNNTLTLHVAVIGAGPAGLIAAETLISGGVRVNIYDAMPSAGRKFLLAGRGGLNLTHSESFEKFIGRYRERSEILKPYLDSFGAGELRTWAQELGFETFVGSSGRVFPVGMDAAPMLRAWQGRLRAAGANFHFRHRWVGWGRKNNLRFNTAQGEILTESDAVILALGGGSRPKTGSTGTWIPLLEARGVEVAPLRPSNCGFNIRWTEYFSTHFAGNPIKTVCLSFGDIQKRGEFVITEKGVEGSLIYAFSATLRDEIEAKGSATIYLDLLPDWSEKKLLESLSQPRGPRSISSFLKKRTGLAGVKASLLWEFLPRENRSDPVLLSAAIKSLPLKLVAPRPLEEAISSAGGVAFEALSQNLMLRAVPGVFCAGEMLDWEAPTGGYLLTACFSTGRAAGKGALDWLFSS